MYTQASVQWLSMSCTAQFEPDWLECSIACCLNALLPEFSNSTIGKRLHPLWHYHVHIFQKRKEKILINYYSQGENKVITS